jgi:hypothetical protein
MKKFIGILMAFAIAFCNLSLLSVDAKVIEPEVVKTEKWTTSYWIDDNADMKYPYIAVEADIYNDGEVKVYWWNTHEWDGFATISHRLTFGELPFSQQPDGDANLDATIDLIIKDRTPFDVEDFHVNLYPKEYKKEYFYNGCAILDVGSIYMPTTLPTLGFSEERPKSGTNGNALHSITFTPTVEPTGTYTFQIFGHEIVITPDILNMDGYKIEEYHSDTAQYEAENEKLKAQNATYLAQIMAYEDEIEMYEILIMDISLERGDVNNDGFINAVDASQILAYYAYTSTGGHLDFMDFVEGKADKEEG